MIFLVSLLSVFAIWSITHPADRSQRIIDTQLNLRDLEKDLEIYIRLEKKYPESLSKMYEYIASYSEAKFRAEKVGSEYISIEKGTDKEFSELNGKGGWYYNKQTGEVRVNLTKPVKKYLKFYFGWDHDEIPSEWKNPDVFK